MTAVVVMLPLMVLMMACGVLLGLAPVSGHAGVRLLPCRCLSPTGQGQQQDC
jgi:hypothetical protein